MMDGDNQAAVVALEDVIDAYCRQCRGRIEWFVQRHFTLRKALQLQRPSLPADLLYYRLNALWAVPYLSVKKLAESLNKVGWGQMMPWLEQIPSGFRTRYQREIERLIVKELLDWPETVRATSGGRNALIKGFQSNPALSRLLSATQREQLTRLSNQDVRRVIENYSSGRAMVSDLAGSAGTVLAGWLLFKDRSLSLVGIGDRIARQRAQESAASQFFLGKGLGSTWYRMFPPEPTTSDIVLATVLVGAALTCLCLAVSLLSDPVRKALGLQRKKLEILIDDLEGNLRLHLTKSLKSMAPCGCSSSPLKGEACREIAH